MCQQKAKISENDIFLYSKKGDNQMRLFVDMDGVLAKWINHNNPDGTPKTWDETYEILTENGYYASLPPIQTMVDSVNNLIKQHSEVDIYILSAALPDTDHSSPKTDKRIFLKKHMAEKLYQNPIFVTYGQSKNAVIEKCTGKPISVTDILLDDYSPNCEGWKQAGGTAIKISNGINCTGKRGKDSWIGPVIDGCIYHSDLFKEIYQAVSIPQRQEAFDAALAAGKKDFKNANLAHLTIDVSEIPENADFSNADMSNTSWIVSGKQSMLRNVNFQGVLISGVTLPKKQQDRSFEFLQCNFKNSTWENVRFLPETSFYDCNMDHSTFTNISNINVDEPDEQKLTSIDIQDTTMEHCIFENVSFDKLSAYETYFDYSSMENVVIDDTYVDSSSLDYVSATLCQFDNLSENLNSTELSEFEFCDFYIDKPFTNPEFDETAKVKDSFITNSGDLKGFYTRPLGEQTITKYNDKGEKKYPRWGDAVRNGLEERKIREGKRNGTYHI